MKAIDLFSGCGGMSLGFMNAGIQIVAAFDNWNAVNTIYELNFDHPLYDIDLMSDLSEKLIKDLNFDMIIGVHRVKIFQLLVIVMKMESELI